MVVAVPCSKPHVEAAIVYEFQPTGVLLFVPKYHMKSAVQLTDRAGRPIPLLREGLGDDLNDPFAVADQQKFTLHHGAVQTAVLIIISFDQCWLATLLGICEYCITARRVSSWAKIKLTSLGNDSKHLCKNAGCDWQ